MALDLSQFTDHLLDQDFTDVDSSGQWRITYALGVTAAGTLALREISIAKAFEDLPPAYPSAEWDAWMRDVMGKRVPGGGITTRMIRSLALEPLRKSAASFILQQSRGKQLPTGVKGPKVRRVSRRPGRPESLTQKFYENVAKRWYQLVYVEKNPHADQTLEVELGRSRSNVAGVIRRCRDKGLIPPTTIAPRVAQRGKGSEETS